MSNVLLINEFSENQKKNKNKNKNTFQQSTGENVLAQAPGFIPQKPAALQVEEVESKYGRRLNWQNDKIVDMRIQFGSFKIGTRYQRCKAYISIKTEDDNRYMIFMRSSLTTAYDETLRSIKKDYDNILYDMTKNLIIEHSDNLLFTGRVKYKVVKGQKISKYHRANLPRTLLIMYTNDTDEHIAELHLIDRVYKFNLQSVTNEKQQQYYSFEGHWEDTPTLSFDEAFNG